MLQGISLIVPGIFILVLSQKVATIIAMNYKSKSLEIVLRIFLVFFGLIFVTLGVLTSMNIVEVISSTPVKISYYFVIFGVVSIISSPILISIIFRKYPDNEVVLAIGKKWFYIFYIGLGIMALTIGISKLV